MDQENSPNPQMAFYRIDYQDSIFVHILMTYMKMHALAPDVPQSTILANSRIHKHFSKDQIIGSAPLQDGFVMTEIRHNGLLERFKLQRL